MADITNNEMQTLLGRLSEDLDNTKGDSVTAEKLESIKKILQKIQSDIAKSSTHQNATAIGKAVAAAISSQANNAKSNTSKNNQSDVVNAAVVRARQEFISEYEKVTDALKSYGATIGNSGSRSQANGSPFNSAFATIEKDAKLTAVGEIIQKVGKGFIDALKGVIGTIGQSIDSFREMSNIGQTFGGSIIGMRDAARAGNMTLAQFTKSLSEGSVGLRELGGTNFAAMSKSLRESMSSVGDFGMTIDDTNKALSEYIDQQRFTTNLNTINQSSLNKNFKDMILNTTNLSGAFGIARTQIIKDAAALAQDPNQNALLSAVDPSKRQDINNVIAAGNAQDPATGKLLREAFSASIGNYQDSDIALTQSANRTTFTGVESAFQDYESGKINAQQLLSAIQKSGKAGSAGYTAMGNISAYANSQSSFGQSFAQGDLVDQNISNLAIKNGAAAQDGAANPTPETAAMLQLQEATNKVAVAFEAAQTTLMRTTEKSTTVLLNDYITATNALPGLSAKLDTFAASLSSIDAEFATFLHSINPATLGFIAAITAAGLEISQFGGAIFGMKLLFDAAKSTLKTLLPSAAGASAASRRQPKTRRQTNRRNRRSKNPTGSAEEAAGADGEAAEVEEKVGGGVLDDIFEAFEFGNPIGLAAGTFAATMSPTTLGTGDTTKYSKNLNLSNSDLYNKVMQQMSPAEFTAFEKLQGSARDNYIKQKAISLGIIKAPPGSKSKPPNPNVTLPSPNPNAAKGPPRQTPTGSSPGSGISPLLPIDTDPNTNGAYASIAASIASAAQSMNAIQAHIDAVAKRLYESELSNIKIQALFTKIEQNTANTYKNIMKYSNTF
jgi:hypothetical protein